MLLHFLKKNQPNVKLSFLKLFDAVAEKDIFD
jgi:hypothetical protein